MDDTLRNAFVIKMEDFLPEMKVLEKGRAALAGSEAVLVIRDRTSLGRCQTGRIALCNLVQFATVAALKLLQRPEEVAARRGLPIEDVAPAGMLRARREAEALAAGAAREGTA